MLPLFLPLWESDATARAAITQSYAAEMTGRTAASLSAIETSLDLGARAAMSSYALRLGGLFGSAVPLGEGLSDPGAQLAGDVGATAGWVTSPHTHVSLFATGYLASPLGVRAYDALAQRDPFLQDRVQYAVGGGTGFSATLSRRTSFAADASYTQAGAVAADSPDAVGIDAHTIRSGTSVTRELGVRDALTPSLRYEHTRFNNALLDVTLSRGRADAHVGTAILTETHAFSRRLQSTVGGGASVATPPPILAADVSAIVAPEITLGLAYDARRYRASASYAFTYTSLGSRIGYGSAHVGTAELAMHPVPGGRFRDLTVTAIARASMGAAPIAASPPIQAPGTPAVAQPDGIVSTWVAVTGGRIDIPLGRGLFASGGVDFQLVHATLSPAPETGNAPPGLRSIVTVALGGVLSTDRALLLPRSPLEETAAAAGDREPSRRDDPDLEALDPRDADGRVILRSEREERDERGERDRDDRRTAPQPAE